MRLILTDMDVKEFKSLALSFPEVVEQPHFEKTSFRVRKKIFVTLDESKMEAVIKLNEIDQSVFSDYDPTTIFPVTNKWGKQGWTVVKLHSVKTEMLRDALKCAYCEVAPKKLIQSLEE